MDTDEEDAEDVKSTLSHIPARQHHPQTHTNASPSIQTKPGELSPAPNLPHLLNVTVGVSSQTSCKLGGRTFQRATSGNQQRQTSREQNRLNQLRDELKRKLLRFNRPASGVPVHLVAREGKPKDWGR